MALWQGKSKRTKTGRKIRKSRGKRKFEIGREVLPSTIGERKIKKVRTRGNNQKIRAKKIDTAYVVDKEKNKTSKAKIKSVLENPANIHYVRRNIITKGAIIETDAGKAKVTSRPGQSGTVNAVLISE